MFCQDIEFHWTSLGTESHLNPNYSAHKQGQKASGTVMTFQRSNITIYRLSAVSFRVNLSVMRYKILSSASLVNEWPARKTGSWKRGEEITCGPTTMLPIL